jgi:eukaryotic-like serine/threonine-protein kinase
MIETLGRYKILATLGQGAMGVVYKAVDPMIDRTVAIKTVNLSLNHDDIAEYEARFQQEIKAAGRLNHPNIVTIYDVGRTDTLAYMAMEFLEGKELKDILAEGTIPAVRDTVEWIAQAASGLGAAHEHNIIHRDVKPSNIMIVKGGLAKITDFGIARMNASAVKTMTGLILGSPRYMSPEQVIGRDLDTRSDIFSLGVVLYETLTGVPPFDGDNVNAIMYSTVNTAQTPPSSFNGDVPPMLDLIVAKALAKIADERYQSMNEFAHDLQEVRRQLNGRTRTVYAKDAPSQPKPVSLDALGVGRLQKTANPADDPQPLSLSKGFDSFSATMKLAALTNQTAEFSEYISETQKMRAYRGEITGALANSGNTNGSTNNKTGAPGFVERRRRPRTGAAPATRSPVIDEEDTSSWIPKALMAAIVLLVGLAIGLIIALLLRS